VALQEVDNGTDRSGGINQAAYIAGQLGMNYRFGKAKEFQNGEFGVAILSRFPVVSDALYDLPDGSDPNSEHRVALEVQVDVPDIYGNTTTVSFVSTHLDPFSDDTRVGQVNAIVNDLAGQAHPVILCGDLNATAESNSVQTLVRSGYLYQDRQLKSTFPATNAYKKIDFITVRTNSTSMASVPLFVGDNAAASDHLFVCTDLHMGASAAWLASHGLAQDGLQGFVDSDEDGINDYREWWYGTDPTDAGEAFAITGGGRAGATSKVKLVWMSAPQDTFTVERNLDLIYESFEVVASGLPANAASNRTEFVDNDSVTNQAAFYRVILED
jgi:endonuclease/exonuclease/phosphatase family metal-dependent hydrolase